MANPATMIVTEVIVFDTLQAIFKIVKDDYINSSDEKDTILYQLFARDENELPIAFNSFNFYEQAKATFLEKNIQINLGYNLEVAAMGSIHILLPSETGQPLAIGADQGYQGHVLNQVQDKWKAIYTQRFNASYNLLITSDNAFECLLIYNLLKSSFLALNAQLEFAGLRLPKIQGQELQFQSDLVPPTIFHRSLILNFEYELNVPDFFYRKLIKNFKITGIIQNKED